MRIAVLTLALAWSPALQATPIGIDLGAASPFAVLAATTVTNTGATTISGSVGVSPNNAITGFSSAVVTNGTIHAGDTVAAQAEAALGTAYSNAAGAACGTSLSGNLGGLTLTAGTYCFSSSAQLTGTLYLDAQGDPNAVFLFQIGSSLVTATAAAVDFLNGGQGSDLFWQVGSSATLGDYTAFAGNILAYASVTLDTGASIACGRALAETGAVTLQGNAVSTCNSASPTQAVPEPASAALLAAAALLTMVGASGRTATLRRRTAIGAPGAAIP